MRTTLHLPPSTPGAAKGLVCLALILLAALSCSTQSKLRGLQRGGAAASLALAREEALPEVASGDLKAHRDTLKVQGPDGREMMIMRAVRSED